MAILELFVQGTVDSHSQQPQKKEQGHASKAQQDSATSKAVPGPSPSTPAHTPPTPLSQPPSPPPTQRTSTHVFNQSTRPVHLSTPPQSADMSTIHPPAPTPEAPPSITQKAPSSKLPLLSLQPNGSAHKLAAAASVSKRSSSSPSSFSSLVSPASIPLPSSPKGSASSSALRAHRPQQSSPRPSGVPVLEPPALQPSSSTKTRQSPALLPLKPASTAPKPTIRGPHTPPEQSPSRPGGSLPTMPYVSTKHDQTKPGNSINNTDLPKHGQQQQHQEPQAGEWTRHTTRRRKAQHGRRVKPANTQASRPAQIQHATQAPRAKPSLSNNTRQHQSRKIQRQAVKATIDLPPKAASLHEAADRHDSTIKAAIQPVSYSAAVGPASCWADVVTPLVGDKVPIAALLRKYHGTDKHEQLIKLTKGSRPFTQYRSIRGESARCIAMRWLHTNDHASSCLAGPGDGDCGFRALLVAILLQVCCYSPAMGASMSARMKVLFDALPEWTQTPAVVAGYTTLKVTLLATSAPFGCESECLVTA